MAFDWEGAGSGALTGAGAGSSFGPWGTAIGGLAGGALGGYLGKDKGKETPIQKKQRQLIDDLLSSLSGGGPYADLFAANEADFERGFAEPARSRFRNQMAPQIQQKYIASGQQRGTGLEDTLTRAGVDIESLINENYLSYLESAKNRQSSALSNILGQPAGALPGQSGWNAALQGVGGYVSSPSFGKDLESILATFSKDKYNQPQSIMDTYERPRKGFEQYPQVYNPYTGVMQ